MSTTQTAKPKGKAGAKANKNDPKVAVAFPQQQAGTVKPVIYLKKSVAERLGLDAVAATKGAVQYREIDRKYRGKTHKHRLRVGNVTNKKPTRYCKLWLENPLKIPYSDPVKEKNTVLLPMVTGLQLADIDKYFRETKTDVVWKYGIPGGRTVILDPVQQQQAAASGTGQ